MQRSQQSYEVRSFMLLSLWRNWDTQLWNLPSGQIIVNWGSGYISRQSDFRAHTLNHFTIMSAQSYKTKSIVLHQGKIHSQHPHRNAGLLKLILRIVPLEITLLLMGEFNFLHRKFLFFCLLAIVAVGKLLTFAKMFPQSEGQIIKPASYDHQKC